MPATPIESRPNWPKNLPGGRQMSLDAFHSKWGSNIDPYIAAQVVCDFISATPLLRDSLTPLQLEVPVQVARSIHAFDRDTGHTKRAYANKIELNMPGFPLITETWLSPRGEVLPARTRAPPRVDGCVAYAKDVVFNGALNTASITYFQRVHAPCAGEAALDVLDAVNAVIDYVQTVGFHARCRLDLWEWYTLHRIKTRLLMVCNRARVLGPDCRVLDAGKLWKHTEWWAMQGHSNTWEVQGSHSVPNVKEEEKD